MAIGKRNISTGRTKNEGAVNVITGNTISRDASSGRFFLIKSTVVERVNTKNTSPKGNSHTASSTKKNEGSLTVNKKKAEQAEQAVLSYLNKSDN